MRVPRVAVLVGVVAVVAALPVGVPALSGATPSGDVAVADVVPEPLCTPADPVLDELSGLAVLGGRLFATPDAGDDESVVELDSECAVVQRFPSPVDPYDVEDLAAGPDGRLWLADFGDNTAVRQTIALISLDPEDGSGELHRLTYPDRAHDAEAVLVGADGVPVIVTKSLFGASGIYRPVRGRTIADLGSPGPTALEKVGSLTLGPTDTPGGPIPGGSSTLITGGAVSVDGTVAAVRTYTDVHLFRVSDGDLAGALVSGPDLRIPVPGEPQGEAVAFTEHGDLLTGSETVTVDATTVRPPITMWPGVTALLDDRAILDDPKTGTVDEEAGTGDATVPAVVVTAGIIVAAAAGFAGWRGFRRRDRRRRVR